MDFKFWKSRGASVHLSVNPTTFTRHEACHDASAHRFKHLSCTISRRSLSARTR
jgi:hypothetical protein